MTFPNPKWLPGISTALDAGPAVDKGGGQVGLPITGNTFQPGQNIVVADSINYNGAFEIVSQTANEIVITATYMPEVFAGTETVVFGKQVILKSDFVALEQAILTQPKYRLIPPLVWVDNGTCRVEATPDCPAEMQLSGLPNIKNPGTQIDGGLSDQKTRTNTADVSCLLGSGDLWGTEKASQWYAIFSLAGLADTTFTLKAMPWMRVKSQAGQVISVGTNPTPATGIGYGFATDLFANGSKIYFFTGDSAGLMRSITHNNNDNGTGGTITYGGTALSVAAGDVFIILPATNFRWLGDVFNNGSSNFTQVDDLIFGKGPYEFMTPGTFTWTCPLTWSAALATGGGGGAGAADSGGSSVTAGGGAGALGYRVPVTPVPGTIYTITVGAKGVHSTVPTPGGNTSLGPLLTLAGGAINIVPGFTVLDYNNTIQGIGGLGQLGFGGFGNGGNGGFNGSPASTDGTAGFLMIERAV